MGYLTREPSNESSRRPNFPFRLPRLAPPRNDQ